MPAESDHLAKSLSILESILDQLACPACRAGLQMEESRLVCTGCGRIYPIVDGIPVLIAEQLHAEPDKPHPSPNAPSRGER